MNIVLSKINFKCELLCSYCLHFLLPIYEVHRRHQMIIFNSVFFELNTDEVTLIWPLLEGFSLNVIFSEDMIGYVREYK